MILLRDSVKTPKFGQNAGRFKKRALAFLLVLACIFSYSFVLAANDIPVTGIALDVDTLDLTAGDTHTFTVTISPDDATNQNIVWTSSDNHIAVVDNGTVTGFSQGSATITATTEDGGFQAESTVNVASITPVDMRNIIRVKLTMNEPTTVPFYLDGMYSVEEDSTVSLPRQFYEIKLEGGSLKLYYDDSVLYSGSEITLKQHIAPTDENNFLWIKNSLYGTRRYLGDMKFLIRDNAITIVNYIYIEEYLWGVVPHEMSNSFPIEALKAQAVAARTFTLRCIGGEDYDLGDTSATQVYKGYHPGNNVAISAVNATENIALQYDNTNITPTYYSASNGGWTEIPYHIWGGGYDWPFYIKYDPYDIANPSSPYETVFFPVNIDDSHPVTQSSNVGTPNIDNAILYFKTEILNSDKLQSAGYSVSSVNDFELAGLLNIVQHTYDSGTSEDHSRMPNTGVNLCPDYILATADFKVKVGSEEVTVSGVELDLRYFDGANDDDTYLVYNMTGLRITVAEPQYEAGVLTGFNISQRRYGHGIGMSQRGAQQRANEGQSYEQIVSFYYPESGAAILNNTKPVLTEIAAPADNSNATVRCNDYLSVRETASTSATRIFTLPPNARIEVVQENYNSSFHMINFGGKNYFVHSGYVDIDVPVPVSGVTLDSADITLDSGAKHTLTATITPADASNKNLTWKSSNTGVATVSSSGRITAVNKGTAVITVTTENGGYTAICNVTVINRVNGVSLNHTSATLVLGDDPLDLDAILDPADPSDTEVAFSSSNTSVATVNSKGIVTAVASGSAVITVTTNDGSHTATCKITVVQELITSSLYTVSRGSGLYEGAPIGISVAEIIDSVNNASGVVRVLDSAMNEVTKGTVTTGHYLQLVIDGEAVDTLQIVIKGDCNPDYILDIIDYTLIRLHILDVQELGGAFLPAADVNDDGIIDIIDYTLVRLHILDVQGLY